MPVPSRTPYGTAYEPRLTVSTGNRPAPRPARSLSREEVAGAALELVDEVGLDGLSMRRLAQRVGVGTMTLYGYFRS